MSGKKVEAEFHFDPTRRVWNMYITYGADDGEYVAKPITLEFEKRKWGETRDATLVFDMQDQLMQALADGLSTANVKAKPDSVLQGSLDATNKHFEDMRKIAFSFIDTKTIA